MTWVAVGVGAASLVGGMMSSNAAKDAASAQAGAASQATQTQWDMYNQTRADQASWRQTGQGALGQLAWLLGIPGAGQAGNTPTPTGKMIWVDKNGNIVPAANTAGTNGSLPQTALSLFGKGLGDLGYHQIDSSMLGLPQAASGFQGSSAYDPSTFGSLTKPFSMADFQQDPGYEFRMKQGLEALDRSGSAAGSSLSGAQLKALTDYGQGMGSQEYGNAWNRWHTQNTDIFNRFASVAGLGQQANSILANVGMNTANQIGGNYNAIGNAQAAGGIGAANAWTSALNGGINNGLNAYYMGQLANGGWGSGQNVLNQFGNGPGGWNAPQTIPT